MKNALVTGATGFIGRALCQRLRESGWSVVGVARRDAPGPWERIITHELGGGGVLRLDFAPDAIFHLASRTHALTERPGEASAYFQTNVGGMRELLAALPARATPRIVFTSSVKAHGESTPRDGLDESSPAAPTTPYGRSKLEAESLLTDSLHGERATVLRLAMVHGAGQKGNLAEMIRAIARGRFPPIAETGNRRSMIHVDDVVAALLACAARSSSLGRTYFVAEPRGYSSRAIYEAICAALGRRPPRWSVPTSVLRCAGWGGDVIGRLRGRRFFWDSDKHAKLFGSAFYRSSRFTADTGWTAERPLPLALPAMVNEALRK